MLYSSPCGWWLYPLIRDSFAPTIGQATPHTAGGKTGGDGGGGGDSGGGSDGTGEGAGDDGRGDGRGEEGKGGGGAGGGTCGADGIGSISQDILSSGKEAPPHTPPACIEMTLAPSHAEASYFGLEDQPPLDPCLMYIPVAGMETSERSSPPKHSTFTPILKPFPSPNRLPAASVHLGPRSRVKEPNIPLGESHAPASR